MGEMAVLLFGLAVVFALFAIKPRALWWKLSAWSYRNPEANEPSDAAYGLQSLAFGAIAIACVVGGINLLGQESPEDRQERRDRCEEVIATLDRVFDGGGVEAVRRRARELDVEVEVRPSPVPAGATNIEIPPSVWVWDRDLPEDDQLLGTVGGVTPHRNCY